MELIKRDVHISLLRASKYTQVTIDEDFNVPDAKPDIERIITFRGNSITEDVFIEENRVKIMGTVCFFVLYKNAQGDGKSGGCELFSGEIPFEETVNVDGTAPSDLAEVRSCMEDLSVVMINSRKFKVRGLVGNSLMVYSKSEISAASGIENASGIECNCKEMSFTDLKVFKSERLSLKEELEIPGSKPNIKEIVWYDIRPGSMEQRMVSGRLQVRGEAELFLIYECETEGLPLQYLTHTINISEELDTGESDDELIVSASIRLEKSTVRVRPDADGESRGLAAELNLCVQIKGYTDEKATLINDMYSPDAEVKTAAEECSYESLLQRNNAVARVTGRDKVRGAGVMQVLNAAADVDIDSVSTGDDSVTVEGAVRATVLYISADDDNPLYSWNTEVPFQYTVNTVPMGENASVRIVPSVSQTAVQLVGKDEIELKAEVNLDIMVFERGVFSAVSEVTLLPIDSAGKAAVPEITGYIVKAGDNLWSIARRYYSTTDSIRAVNSLESDEIKPGDKLIIVKA